MISSYIQVKLDEGSPQFLGLELYAKNNGFTTTPAAILSMINSLPETIKLKNLRGDANPSLANNPENIAKPEGCQENSQTHPERKTA